MLEQCNMERIGFGGKMPSEPLPVAKPTNRLVRPIAPGTLHKDCDQAV